MLSCTSVNIASGYLGVYGYYGFGSMYAFVVYVALFLLLSSMRCILSSPSSQADSLLNSLLVNALCLFSLQALRLILLLVGLPLANLRLTGQGYVVSLQ